MLKHTILWLPIIATMLTALGCMGIHYEQDQNDLDTETVFDHRLPADLDSVFAQCHEPLTISPAVDEIDWSGSCSSPSGMTTGEAFVWLAMSTQDPLNVGTLFPPSMIDVLKDTIVIDDLPFPVQNCKITIDLDLDLDGIELMNMNTRWVTRNRKPALAIDFDRNVAPIASGYITGTADCPSPINRVYLQPLMPNGFYSLGIDDFDLDIWIVLDQQNGQLVASAEVATEIGDFTMDPGLLLLNLMYGDIGVLLESIGITPEDLEGTIQDALSGGLGPLASEIAALIQNRLPDDHQVCDMEVSGGELTIRTQPSGGLCARRGPIRPLPFP